MRSIDADALIHHFYETEYASMYYVEVVKRIIDAQPTLSPDEVRGVGEWIRLDIHKGMEQYKCSVCETPTYVPECMNNPMYGYCPNCGARMKGAEDGTTD